MIHQDTLQSDVNSKIIIRQEFPETKQKAYKTGMYFPSKIICEIKASIKRGGDWKQNQLLKLTTEAFAEIPISSINKIKYYTIKDSDKLLLKINTDKSIKYYKIDRLYSNDLFSKVVWSRMATFNLFSNVQDFKGSVEGLIMKKSQILGNWQTRIVKITKQNGLQSSKSVNETASLNIKQIGQFWTRFQTIQQEQYLVVKFFYGIVKLQFGIPIENAVEWVQGFCNLLNQNKN